MYRTHLRTVVFHISKRLASSGKGSKKSNVHKKPTVTNKKPTYIVKRIKPPNDKPSPPSPSAIFQPTDVLPPKRDPGEDNVGEELAGKLEKDAVVEVLKKFTSSMSMRKLAAQYGIEGDIFMNSIQSFRRYILHAEILSVDLHIILSDIIADAGHSDDLFPYFLAHSKEVYPHLSCLEDLKNISDISDPANWYRNAREIKRKFIFHAGPTNSGKTYHALKRFMKAERGIYCGPLRLLAMEVFDKCNEFGTPCDLVTGETRKFIKGEEPSDHLACTVEMVNTAQPYDVAVIDEIQMIADLQRGWAWTRAVLGVAAKEVHVCGERRAVELIKDLVTDIGDEFELRVYTRLTSLTYLTEGLGGYDKIRPGDCIVCFSKNDIFRVSRKLSSLGFNAAVIYGALPPGTKIMQSRRFNDPNDPCNVLVATDAIGMGLNLAIKRIIFYSLLKTTLNEAGNHEVDYLSSPQLKQIGGRAGRYKTQYKDGEVTCFKESDIAMMHNLLEEKDDLILRAGLNPTAEQIEMFSFHLPGTALSSLMEIFYNVCSLDKNNYFMCISNDFRELADLIEHLPIPIRIKFTFCSAPIRLQNAFAKAVFLKMSRQFATGEAITFEWMYMQLGGPFKTPRNMAELERLEGSFSAIDLYLWLSYRYPDMFYDSDAIRALRIEIDNVIQKYLKSSSFVDTLVKMQRKQKETKTLSKAAMSHREGLAVFAADGFCQFYRYPDMFYDSDAIRALRIEIDNVIQKYLKSSSFVDTLVKMQRKQKETKKLSKAAMSQIEKMLGTGNPMSKYDPPPKIIEDEDTEESESSDSEEIGLDELKTISDQMKEMSKGVVESDNPAAKYEPVPQSIKEKCTEEKTVSNSEQTNTTGRKKSNKKNSPSSNNENSPS